MQEEKKHVQVAITVYVYVAQQKPAIVWDDMQRIVKTSMFCSLFIVNIQEGWKGAKKEQIYKTIEELG